MFSGGRGLGGLGWRGFCGVGRAWGGVEGSTFSLADHCLAHFTSPGYRFPILVVFKKQCVQ